MMTEQEMRVAIAEACGWTKIRMTTKGAGAPERRPCPHGFPPGRKYEAPVTDYLNDLNAMHEAEKACIYSDHDIYVRYENHLINTAEHPLHATAKQRATAFCMTLFPERFKE